MEECMDNVADTTEVDLAGVLAFLFLLLMFLIVLFECQLCTLLKVWICAGIPIDFLELRFFFPLYRSVYSRL